MSDARGRDTALVAAAAAICGLLAAWLIAGIERDARQADGVPTTVLVTTRALHAGDPLAGSLAARRLPARFAPAAALTGIAQAEGGRAAYDVSAGAYATRDLLAAATRTAGFRLRRGERAVTVDALVDPLGAVAHAGDRVDIVASGIAGAPQSGLLLAGAQVLGVADGATPRHAALTLRVGAAQTPAVVRADVFARELRALLAR